MLHWVNIQYPILNSYHNRTVYIFCGNDEYQEQWIKNVNKVQDIYTKIDPICKALQTDRKNCDQAIIMISFNAGGDEGGGATPYLCIHSF